MAPCHATLRRKLYSRFKTGVVPQHGHFLEYAFMMLNMSVSVSYVYGSWTFLYSDLTEQGAWIFVIGSAIVFLMQMFHIIEERHHSKHCPCCDPIVNRRAGSEFLEHCSYAVAAFVFSAGSFYYMPGIGGDPETNESRGSACFILGSFGFVLASFFNAIGMAANKDENKFTPVYVTCHYLFVTGLVSSQIGSMLFFTGSCLYRPELSNGCGTGAVDGVEPAHECVNPATLGTYFYILGSALYLLEAFCGFASSALRHVHGDSQVSERGVNGLKQPLRGS